MAHPHPPLSPFDPTSRYFGFPPSTNPAQDLLPPPQPADNTNPDSHSQPATQNLDRLLDPLTIPPAIPPLPAMSSHDQPPAPPAETEGEGEDHADPADPEEQLHDESHSDSEDEEEPPEQFHWQPIEEDKSEPSEDELAYIASQTEHSATDQQYWEKKTFFELNDPELVPGESGKIDWLVENFNGTKENPNKEVVMRSPVVSVGGYDWRIKFYPRGNDTDYLSLYLECVSMQADDYEGSEDFSDVALPFLSEGDKLKKQRAVAAQLSIVMYNPAEPRTYEYHRDAHKFTKSNADYGWTRFSHFTRRDFHIRRHTQQRRAILRDDKLAFAAYIRIVDDPTGCLWAHGTGVFAESVTLTGLRPFTPQMPMFAAELPLLHFAPFRKFISGCKNSTRIVFWMQTLLYKMLSRKSSTSYGGAGEACVQSDTVAWLRFLAKCLRKETSPAAVTELVGSLDPERGAAVSYNRLKTKKHASVQAAVDAHTTEIEKPLLLTLELERQEFDREKRRWEKLTNKVEMQDEITVSGTSYTLYSFATHSGDLESMKFNSYIRPNGPSRPWYRYSAGSVTCMTHKQAVGKHSGYDEPPSPIKHKRPSHRSHYAGMRELYRQEEVNEVAHVVMYVREDFVGSLTALPTVEEWVVPRNVVQGIPPSLKGVVDDVPPATAVYERFSELEEPPPEEAPVVTEPPPPPPASDEQVPPPLEDVASRRPSLSVDAGSATPNCWLMDGEDVVMSDADSDAASVFTPDTNPTTSLTTADANPQDEKPELTTIDLLGREYYHGPLLHGLYHGPNAHLISMNGDEYRGAFLSGQKSGQGTLTYARSGDTYTGTFASDLRSGTGTLVEKASGNVYTGGWADDKRHGEFVLKGTMTDDDKGVCSGCGKAGVVWG
ncbi:uncharacterized protein LTR77_008426 [Saxophila tyrrhenica]|uniref:MATH domain-containing protein n=1 Tax=Saxophila tyrrhenica TaxID=1690608 RepID=A0AAV9P4L3_9PEZI|nr:hypothetical protein LTR77_008426 [Saxophila tyrrhenica]